MLNVSKEEECGVAFCRRKSMFNMLVFKTRVANFSKEVISNFRGIL